MKERRPWHYYLFRLPLDNFAHLMTSRLFFALLLLSLTVDAQYRGSALPDDFSRKSKFIFYLHGGVVTEHGDMAISEGAPEWGAYEYSNILDSLRIRNVNVISEIRKKDIDNDVYANKIASQIDSLLDRRVSLNNILVLGASAGWDIALKVSDKMKKPGLHFVVMGGCWPDTYKDYQQVDLTGHFLSLIEKSDPHGSCSKLFEKRSHMTSYREITLNTGLSHGFIYRGYPDWINPVMEWWSGALLR
jgi:hypothetical protein